MPRAGLEDVSAFLVAVRSKTQGLRLHANVKKKSDALFSMCCLQSMKVRMKTIGNNRSISTECIVLLMFNCVNGYNSKQNVDF